MTAPTTRETADHAELARLAEAATKGPWLYRDMTPNTYGPAFVDAADVQSLAICGEAIGRSETHGFCLQVDSDVRMANAAFIAAANPATVLALLSEIAALRGEVSQSKREYRDDVGKHIARAAQAKRQRDELRKALERIATVDMGGGFLGAMACRQAASEALANQGADQ